MFRTSTKMLRTQQLMSAIKPLIVFSNFSCFLMFRIKNDGIYIPKMMTIIAFIFLVFCVSCKRLMTFEFFQNYSFVIFSQAVLNLSDISITIFAVISHLNFVIYGKSIVKTWNNLIKYADFVTDESYYKKVFRMVCFEIVALSAVIIVHFASAYSFKKDLNIWWQVFQATVNHCLLSHFCALTILFSNSLHFARKIISLANEELETLRRIEHYKNIPSVSEMAFVKRDKVARMRSTMRIIKNENLFSFVDVYEKVCALCVDLNEFFGVSLMVNCLHNMLEVVLTSYLMTLHDLTKVPIFSFWVIFFFVLNWIVLNACENFMKESKKTGLILNSLITENSNVALKEAVQRFSLNLLHRKVKFTACNLFTLDYKLLYSVFTSLITYLVIFIQFDRQ